MNIIPNYIKRTDLELTYPEWTKIEFNQGNFIIHTDKEALNEAINEHVEKEYTEVINFSFCQANSKYNFKQLSGQQLTVVAHEWQCKGNGYDWKNFKAFIELHNLNPEQAEAAYERARNQPSEPCLDYYFASNINTHRKLKLIVLLLLEEDRPLSNEEIYNNLSLNFYNLNEIRQHLCYLNAFPIVIKSGKRNHYTYSLTPEFVAKYKDKISS